MCPLVDPEKDEEMQETKRIMERLVNTPPQPKGGKAEKEGGKPAKKPKKSANNG